MTLTWTILLLSTIYGAEVLVEHADFPGPIKKCLDARAKTTDITRSVGGDIIWKCIQVTYAMSISEYSGENR